MKRKLYVVIRNDLDLAYQGVQGGHAVAQWLLENPDQTWNNHYLIYCEVDNLNRFKYKLNLKNIKFSEFIEPDMDYQATAVAFQTTEKWVEKLKLMGA